jgi:hypothetical protein
MSCGTLHERGPGKLLDIELWFCSHFRLYSLKNTERQELAVSTFEIETFELAMYDIIDFLAAALVPQEQAVDLGHAFLH